MLVLKVTVSTPREPAPRHYDDYEEESYASR
jgi:hypothetical protein